MTEQMSILRKSSAITIAMAILMGSVQSLASAPTVITRPAPKAETPKKQWVVPLTLETSSTVHAADSYEKQAMTAFTVAPSYQLSKNLRISAATMVYKEETSPGNSGFDNTLINLSYSQAFTPATSWFVSTAGILPTNQQMRDETSYQGAARLGTGVLFTNLFFKSSLRYVLNLTRNFHEMNITASETFNVRETVSQALEYTLPFNDQWSLQTVASYTYGQTYKDDMRTRFYTGIDLSWAVRKDLIISTGISNEGNALKPNGADSNISFYDDTSSVVKLGITYIL